MKTLFFLIILIISSATVFSMESKIVVSKKSTATFKTIQDAINSIKNDKEKTIIFIENGIYNEKIFIKKSNIQFIGENKNNTIIQQSISREIWRCNNETDWGVATINVDSCENILFKNLTIKNNYGFENKNAFKEKCFLDSNKVKLFSPNGHQMAFRSFFATKLKFKNCVFISNGGDTMSPWNLENGMFYFNECYFEGGVDLFCPRGFSFAENCIFNATSGTAIIWHDGSNNKDFKSVFKNCSFKGMDSFNLGRFHKESQFYLINCTFAKNMTNKDIFKVQTNNIFNWGRRVYYYNCSKAGSKYNFYNNNIAASKKEIYKTFENPYWVFNQKWNPYL